MKKKLCTSIFITITADKDSLAIFASKAYKSLLQDIEQDTPAPDELFQFSIKGKGKAQKRERVPTKRIEESRKQATTSPKKKKKTAEKTAVSTTSVPEKKKEIKNVPSKQKKKTVSSHTALETGKEMLNIFKQFSTCSATVEQETSPPSTCQPSTTLSNTWNACTGALRSLDLGEENVPSTSNQSLPGM